MSDTAFAGAGKPRTADVAQAICALLPAAVLAWPFTGSVLAHDLAPRTTGFGFAVLLSLPGIVWFVLRTAAPSVRASWLLVIVLLGAAHGVALTDPSDRFEASRALIGWALVLFTVLAGACSSASTLARGATLLAIAYSCAAFGAPHAGALGNSGATSEAATLGAAAGGALLVRDRGAWRALGALAIGTFLAHAFLAPVLAGSVAAAVALGALAFTSRGAGRATSAVLAGCALCVLALPIVRHAPAAATTPTPTASIEASPAGGASVRLGLLRGASAMFRAHTFSGVGPGQFAAAFPPFRDAREIEASSHGRALGAETEVEHAHDDWIQPALEGGIVVGLAWIAFLVVVLRQSWIALRGADPARAALGAGLIALLVHALARAPITANAASSTLFAAAAGALLWRADAPKPGIARRFVAISSVLLVLVLTPRAWSMVKHGFALQELEHVEGDPARAERAVARAAAAAPDSVVARTLEARLAEAHGEPPVVLVERWASVLALRPHRIEALVQLAIAQARDRQLGAARATLGHVLALDARHPAALQNLATLELQQGELEAGLAHLEQVSGGPDAAWLRGWAARLALRGLDRESDALSRRADPSQVPASPEERYALAKELRAQGAEERADGWEARAHWAWATQHAEAGRWSEAVRSLRQDLRLCSERPGATPVRVRLALSAALLGAGREDEAREQARDLEVSQLDAAALPTWARERLTSAGLLP